jgi:dTDP-4-dehydrorhamnose 3,5-epimerase
MQFTDLHIAGPFVIDLDPIEDERGSFARTWCTREFTSRGIHAPMVQSSVSVTHQKGTLRGLHFQRPPSREGKLVRCTHGKVFDVIVDLRCDSPTFLQHAAITLSAENSLSIYVPPGFAHGFQTLVPDSVVLYMMNDYCQPEHSAGIRWNDPAISIPWPMDIPSIMSDRDRNWPDFDPAAFEDFSGY